MAMKMLIDATHAEETRVVVVDGTKVEEFDFETANRRQIAGNIYLAKVTRVEPSLQAAFIDYGGNRHGFLAFAEIHPDYYQIPAADRDALMAEDRAHADAQEAEEERGRSRRNSRAERAERAEAQDEATSEGDDGQDAEGQDASDKDDDIESVADEDVTEEVRAPRKPRARRYKIQEVVKVRQIMLVQVVKEERGNKGAALTTYLSLPGRYCVLMPNTARGGGISRKITNAADRKKLKDIAGELDVPKGAGLIIRTAGSERTRTEIRRDYEYLLRLWEQIRELTFRSIAPAPIYEEGDLIKRNIRDLYSKDIDEVLVEGERGYHAARDFMQMIMPTHTDSVKHYQDQMPLFARFQVESYLAGMFNPTVQLKSGGYIVIGITEALVAIDVNSGRATKEGSIEETALKTNLEAADEVARQLRLRDLAGLIVIDFIDMDERRNNAAVEKRIKDKLKSDRARIQIGRISGFGLMEMSRQRLRPGMLESTTQPCAHCHGTGLIRSDDSLALTILRAIEDEGTRKRSREVLVKAPIAVANFLMNGKREHVANIEARYGMSVRVEADPLLVSPDYAIEKFKTATRVLPEPSKVPLGVNADLMASIDDEEDLDEIEQADEPRTEAPAAEAAPARTEPARAEAEAEPRASDAEGDAEGEGRGRRRRRRRRRKPGDRPDQDGQTARSGDDQDDDEDEDDTQDATGAPEVEAEDSAAPTRSGRSRRRGGRQDRDDRDDERSAPEAVQPTEAAISDAAPAEDAEAASEAEPAGNGRTRTRSRGRGRSRRSVEAEPMPEVADLADSPDGRAEALPDLGAAPVSDPEASQMRSAAQADSAPAAPFGSPDAPVIPVSTGLSQAGVPEAEAVAEALVESAAAPADAQPEPAEEDDTRYAVAPAPVPAPAPAAPPAAANQPQPATQDSAPQSKRRGWWSGS
ncbi:ribonuclease E/G [Paracoccus gahaiensis]|uniref:Ribonuclease E n=1 Tax=Paracoccus gahaiensis TaxID=1706839 RepID=A0A4U0R8V6_9RHOB|nr:ribonuclease E/G [Paracoccus gahaiensis]TJZ91571.1 ribonuclease E/G [Paracoccus gahaiensis]